jgi:uncharacterized membrane protein YdjX (TVP38/TMEM64 family)
VLKHIKNWRVLGAFLLLLLLALVVFWEPLLELLSFISDREAFTAYIYRFGWLGPVVLAALHLVQVVISIVPGDVFYLAGGYIYGLVPGFILNLIVTVGAGLVAFSIARRWGRPVVDRLAPAKVIDRWDVVAKRHGFVFFLMSFMLPIFPTDTMNYVAGLSSIPLQQYALASVLGRAPLIFLVTLLGAHGTDLASVHLAPLVLGIVIVVIIALYVVWLTVFRQLTTEVREL